MSKPKPFAILLQFYIHIDIFKLQFYIYMDIFKLQFYIYIDIFKLQFYVYLTIILRGRAGYRMIDNQRGA